MIESIFFCRAWEAYIGSKISHMYFHIYTHSILYEESSIYICFKSSIPVFYVVLIITIVY